MNDRYSIYVHIPFCKARCGYCAFCSCTDFSLTKGYFDKLFEEIEHYADKSKRIATLYLGGGTPSAVNMVYIDKLFEMLNKHFDLSAVEEVTAECNPESATVDMLSCLRRNGVNRLSFGLQSVNDATLRKIGRLHDYECFIGALAHAWEMGFDNINADLIIGLPERREDFLHSVETVTQLPLEHISMYALELHEHTPLYRALNGKPTFDDDTLADMYDDAVMFLAARGFRRYEISNFAREGRQCKHNLNYWQEGRYFAFGASASGFVENVRYTDPRTIAGYLACPTEQLHLSEREVIDRHEEANEFAMLGLRLEQGVSRAEFGERFGEDFSDFFTAANGLAKCGLLLFDGDRVRVPTDKFYVVDSILADLWQDKQ